jgi:hypothetical protein
MYACGLRIGEAATLEIASIDSDSLLLRIGKGNKERRVPLPRPMISNLRCLWLIHRNPRWLCPNRLGTGPVSKNALWRTFRLSLRATGITRPVSPHALRHSYATRLLKNGVDTSVVTASAWRPTERISNLAGPARAGLCLLQGVLICGMCGRRLSVRYTAGFDALHRRPGHKLRAVDQKLLVRQKPAQLCVNIGAATHFHAT